MPSCHLLLNVGLLFLSVAQIATSFVAPFSIMSRPTTLFLRAKEETIVEVCGFKDCKRAGGGPRLQKLVKEVRVSAHMHDCGTSSIARRQCSHHSGTLVLFAFCRWWKKRA